MDNEEELNNPDNLLLYQNWKSTTYSISPPMKKMATGI